MSNVKHYISGSGLGPVQCSAGGVPYNKEHIDAQAGRIAELEAERDRWRERYQTLSAQEKRS